jgi:hypothetical protein
MMNALQQSSPPTTQQYFLVTNDAYLVSWLMLTPRVTLKPVHYLANRIIVDLLLKALNLALSPLLMNVILIIMV